MEMAGVIVYSLPLIFSPPEPTVLEYGLPPAREFLSDAPFLGLCLWTEFKLANCACASGWSCLMNLDLRSKFWLFLSCLGSFVGVSSCQPCSSKSYVHCEVEVHTVYKRLFKKADKGLHPMQHISTYFACLS